MKYKAIVLLILFVFISCKNKYYKIYSLIDEIEKSMTPENLKELKNLSEHKSNEDFYYPIYYKDSVLLLEENRSTILYFNSLGVDNYNDMTNILFTVLHRRLNKKPLEIENLIELSINGKTVFSPKDGNVVK